MVVLCMEVAGNAATVLRWHPQVGAASVQHDLECLRRCANLDLREVLGVQEVLDGYWVTFGSIECWLLEDRITPVQAKSWAHVLLCQRGDMCTDVGVLLNTVSATIIDVAAMRVIYSQAVR